MRSDAKSRETTCEYGHGVDCINTVAAPGMTAQLNGFAMRCCPDLRETLATAASGRSGHQSLCGAGHVVNHCRGGFITVTGPMVSTMSMMPFGVHVLDRPVDASEHDRHPDAALQRGPLVKQRFIAAESAHGAVETEIGFDAVLEVGRCPALRCRRPHSVTR